MIPPKITHSAPASGLVAYWIGRLWMWIFGWDVVGQVPEGEKFVLIGAPHTSNWDFPFSITALYIYRLKISWIGKNALFKRPFGWFMRWLGGIAIDRDHPRGVVNQLVKLFNNSEKLVIVIAPPGTRKKRDYWKSGFYRIAYSAKVPIVCGYIDYKNRKVRIDHHLMPSGNIKKDMDSIREFYKGIKGKYLDKATEVRLRDEDA